MMQFKKNILLYLYLAYGLCVSSTVCAFGDYQAHPNSVDIGEVAGNMSEALSNIVELVLSVTTIAGVVFCFVAAAKLYQHKKNPQQVPLSQFFIMLVLGTILIALPFILKYGNSAYNVLGNTDYSTNGRLA